MQTYGAGYGFYDSSTSILGIGRVLTLFRKHCGLDIWFAVLPPCPGPAPNVAQRLIIPC